MQHVVPPTALALAALAFVGSAHGDGGVATDGIVVMRCVARTVVYRWPVEPAALPQRCRVAGMAAPAAPAAPKAAASPPAAPRAGTAAEAEAAPASGAAYPWLVPRETQRQRDAWARAIVQQELQAAEARLGQLQAQGLVDAGPPRGEMQQLERSLAALRRELARLP